MKILHVVNISFVLPYFIGSQFDYFPENNFEFHIACSNSDHFNLFSKDKKFKSIGIKISRKFNIIDDIKAIHELTSYIKSNQIDLVVGHTPKGGFVSMIAALLSNVKTRVYFRHGLMYETSKGLKRHILVFIESLTAIMATKVVCVSKSVMLKSKLDIYDLKKSYILLGNGTCNGIDAINRFNPSLIDQILKENIAHNYSINKNDFVVGFVGRIVKDKGICELLDAWKIFARYKNNIKLLLVGPFEDRDTIDDVYKNYINVEDSIVHVDYVENTEYYYSLMNVFILPSYREGFPTVVLEASAMQIPVITTLKTGCIDSILPNQTGIFTEIDPHLIKNAIDYYFINSDQIKIHGFNGRNHILNNFQHEIIWEEIKNKVYTKS